MTLAAAFALLLRRYSGASTLAIGTPMANRLREQDEDCIGFFANTLVLRCDLTGNPTFRDLLQPHPRGRRWRRSAIRIRRSNRSWNASIPRATPASIRSSR